MKNCPCLRLLLLFPFLSHSFIAISQIEFKLHWMEADQQWGVFARLEPGAIINSYNIIGSGQVTLLAPVGTGFADMQNISGEWMQNAYISAPAENPQADYISFGLTSNDPEIMLVPDQETLLFTFKPRDGECPEFLSLITNDDPLAIYPNSVSANAGNDLSVMDPKTMKTFGFSRNYMPEAWNCHPGKTVPLENYLTGKDRYKAKVPRP